MPHPPLPHHTPLLRLLALALSLPTSSALAAPPAPEPKADMAEVQRLWQSKSASNRCRAINMLAGVDSEAATRILLAALQDLEPASMYDSPCSQAIDILADRKEPRAVGPLINLLIPRPVRVDGKTVNTDYSNKAALALGKIGDPKAAKPILGVLTSRIDANFKETRPVHDVNYYSYSSPPVPNKIEGHITALGQLHYPQAAPVILKALRGVRPLRKIEIPGKPPELFSAPIYPRTKEFRKLTFDALADMPGEPTTTALVDLLINPALPDSDLEDAQALLATQKDPAAIPLLLKGLKSFPTMTPAQLQAITQTLTLLTNDPAPGNDPQAWLSRPTPPTPPSTPSTPSTPSPSTQPTP